MPQAPILIFDGDCGFCRRWIERWRRTTGDRVRYEAYQAAASQYPQIPKENFKRSVQFVDSEGQVTSGAKAVFKTLSLNPSKAWLLWIYEKLRLFAWVCEASYRLVASNRILFSKITRFFWGDSVLPSTYRAGRFVFLRLLGLIYFMAFISLFVQLPGLLGEKGILPIREFLDFFSGQIPGRAPFFKIPTIFWLRSDDFFLKMICGAGVFSAFMAILGFLPGLFFILCWFFYLSFVSTGQDFLSFQWDNLLLEAGFLAIFYTPFRFWDKSPGKDPVPWPFQLVFRFLLFKLMFSSGVVKLASGDQTWKNLTALTYHYETQPLPWMTSWFAHQMPVIIQKVSCGVMFFIELIVPFFFFLPRRPRHFALSATIFLQGLILLTGNYGYFNYLAIALCLVLIDDEAWMNLPFFCNVPTWQKEGTWREWIALPLAVLILLISIPQVISRFDRRLVPSWTSSLDHALRPFRSISPYGLFAVMTTQRMEIIVEGSDDGRRWEAYEFKYKPGDLKSAPLLVAPHQPRLDWQMWFAALGNYRQNPWFINFCARLLQGHPEVTSLLKKNPFPEKPPRFVRALAYEYHFTKAAEKKRTGEWWKRESKGIYLPAISLKN